MTIIYWQDYVESSCRQNNSYITSAGFMINSYHLVALITIPLSIFTFYVIIRVTPRKMANMKIPLLIAHACSTNLDLCFTVFVAPYAFFPTAAGFPLGALAALGVPSKWTVYISQVSITIMGINFIMLLENRHSQLPMVNIQITSKKVRFVYFALNYLLSPLYILPFYIENVDQMELRQFVLKRVPCASIEFYDKHTVVLLKGGELSAFISTTGALVILLSQTLFFSAHTIYHLNYVKNAKVSESTKELQRKFLHDYPMDSSGGPCIILIVRRNTDYYNQAINNLAMLFMGIHGLLSTSCTLYIIKPYREFVLSILRRDNEFNASEMWATNAALSVAD